MRSCRVLSRTNERDRMALTAFILWVFLSAGLVGCGGEEPEPQAARADVIVIDTLSRFGALEWPPVTFKHDYHTSALREANQDCSTCHLRDAEGDFSLRFQRLQDDDPETVMNTYHEKCIGCHEERRATGLSTGPVVCGECHRIEPRFVSSACPMGMDHSLHQRHSKASGDKCETCHHEYDPSAKKLTYEKGKESSCRDCHGDRTEENRRSMRAVSHVYCIGCHKEERSNQRPAGPVDCQGCHDLEQQKKIRKIEEIPRLHRGQPDAVFVRPASSDLALSKMNTVPFDHKRHEGVTQTCRVCHHESLKACRECHSVQGMPEGRGVTLARSMHDPASDRSCVGCHDVQKSAANCAGCHSLIPNGAMSDMTCQVCHSGPAPEAAREGGLGEAAVVILPPKATMTTIAGQKMPDKITLGAPSDLYEAAVFPHRQVLDGLLEKTKASPLALRFHAGEGVVCQACHHNSPAGVKPPACASCHTNPSREASLFMPALQGALHLQCIGCHLEMGIKGGAECTVCHAAKLSVK